MAVLRPGYLRAAVKQEAIEIWVDEFLRAGAKWNFEIERKLREWDILVLLCSHHSLSSGYVVDKELAIVRERQKNGEDVRIVPLLLRREIEKRTPEMFEPPVAQDIGRIAQAEPPVAPTEPLPAHLVGPPPLLADAPDPKKSRQYQLAASANALWGTFLKGKDLPVAIEGWSKIAQELGQAAKPFLDFLRDLMS